MDILTKEKIYNRLLGMNIEISFDHIPDPSHINSQLGLCHVFMEEVEKMGITVNREISLTQRFLTDSLSHYEFLKQDLMASNMEIKNLPNIKDREAKADSLLKENLDTIRTHKNELSDLKNLIRVINMKQKSLYRINNDVKLQIRLLESQLKIDSGLRTDPAAQSLMEEFKKSSSNRDSFENSTSTQDHSVSVDDSSDAGINKVLDSIPENLFNPEPKVSSIIESAIPSQGSTPATPHKEMPVDAKPKEEKQEAMSEETRKLLYGDEEEKISPEDEVPISVSEEILREVDASILTMKSSIDIVPDGVTKKPEPKQNRVPVEVHTQPTTKSKDSIDIDALLKDFK